MNQHLKILEFNRILDKLAEHALSEQARDELMQLEPYLNETMCRRKMDETSAARRILDTCGSPPLPTMTGLSALLHAADTGAMLLAEQLTSVARFAIACRQVAAYCRKGESVDEAVAVYGRSLEDLAPLRDDIEGCIREDTVVDEASPALRDIRRRMEHAEAGIKEKLGHVLQSRKQYLADSYVTVRGGRHVVPVQRKFQSQFGGTVIEASGKGAVVFMEPHSVARLQDEYNLLAIDEDAEVRRILYTLTARVAEYGPAIRRNVETLVTLDVLFAKAKLSAAMNARSVAITTQRTIDLREAQHPLLPPDSCVPLDFCVEGDTRGVIITGPNTGGKTVTVKTVGLLSLMAQCGLHIPCAEGSVVAMHDAYYCDIGDNQDISQNLSTFSGHMLNVIGILERASRDSLVLLDELGSGTDPAEGMGIAVAVLDELHRRGCLFLVTTHYPQVKTYAEQTPGVQSARMAFDRDSLRPLYRLEMGRTGESCALHIAQRLGLPAHLLARAQYEVYGGDLPDSRAGATKAPASRLVRTPPPKGTADVIAKFTMGDSVVVLPEGELGIVYRPADERGDVIVQVKGDKRAVRHNRLKLQNTAAELYPPDYDFSIIFDTVDNRKARHRMGKRHDPNAIIQYDE